MDLADPDELEDALALNGSTFKNNTIRVEKAKPKTQKEPQKEQTKPKLTSPLDKQNKGDNESES